jgi:hypothetical protein
MTGTKVWQAFRPGELTIPSAQNQMLAFLAPDSSDPNRPVWVTYPGDTLPLVGRVMLAGRDGQLLVRPWIGHLICIKGRAVKLTPAANGVKLQQHINRFRDTIHTKKDVVRIVTELLTANQRSAGVHNSYVKFTRCAQPTCGYSVGSRMVMVKKGEKVPGSVFYISHDKGSVVEEFLSENSCYCVYLHRHDVH